MVADPRGSCVVVLVSIASRDRGSVVVAFVMQVTCTLGDRRWGVANLGRGVLELPSKLVTNVVHYLICINYHGTSGIGGFEEFAPTKSSPVAPVLHTAKGLIAMSAVRCGSRPCLRLATV